VRPFCSAWVRATRGNYRTLAGQIVSYGYVFVVTDSAPGDPFGKADPAKYAALVKDLKNNLLSWTSAQCNNLSHWIIGGHSASGQGAHAALSADATLADAVFSADPYDCSSLGNIQVPALYWGFSSPTCLVNPNAAAKACYARTSITAGRAMHKVQVTMKLALCGLVPNYHHASFIDYGFDLGTIGCFSCLPNPNSFYADVANSLSKFINARFYGFWNKANLQVRAFAHTYTPHSNSSHSPVP
jgi:hypothetical protein